MKRRLNIGARERSSCTPIDPLVSTHFNILTRKSHSDLEYCNIIIYYYTLNVYMCVNVLTVCWKMIDVQQRYDDDDDDSDVVSDVTVYIYNILGIMCLCVWVCIFYNIVQRNFNRRQFHIPIFAEPRSHYSDERIYYIIWPRYYTSRCVLRGNKTGLRRRRHRRHRRRCWSSIMQFFGLQKCTAPYVPHQHQSSRHEELHVSHYYIIYYIMFVLEERWFIIA